MNSVNRYFTDIGKGFWTILIGMKVTMRHLFTPAVTVQYPDARIPIPERGRNRLYVNMDDCIGCNQCAMACPVDCITLETAKSLPTEDLGVTSTGQKKRLWVTKFDVDLAKCCYCGLCVPPCPTECIYMTDVFEFSEYDRGRLNYSFITLTPEEVTSKITQAKEMEREAAAKKAAVAAAAARKAAEAKAAAAQQAQSGAAKPQASPAPAPQQPAATKPESTQQNVKPPAEAQPAPAAESKPPRPLESAPQQPAASSAPKPDAGSHPAGSAPQAPSEPKATKDSASSQTGEAGKPPENHSGGEPENQTNNNPKGSSD